jgi:hypothetical protein
MQRLEGLMVHLERLLLGLLDRFLGLGREFVKSHVCCLFPSEIAEESDK